MRKYIYNHAQLKILAVLLSFVSALIQGPIKINTQAIASMHTYSGGFPATWLELYYPKNVDLTLSYIISHWVGLWKLDLFVFLINTVLLYYIMKLLVHVFRYCRHPH